MGEIDQSMVFVKQYRDYVQRVLEPTNRELRQLLKSWREPGYWASYAGKPRQAAPCPVERCHTRIKRPESVVDKIHRKPDLFPAGLTTESFLSMPDTLGARVVIYFLSDFATIHSELTRDERIRISDKPTPVAYLTEDLALRYGLYRLRRDVKESGYASVHYVLQLAESSVPEEERPWFELQVRTMAEDVWGEIHHVLGYKPKMRTGMAVTKQFQIISQALIAIDEHFDFLYQELGRFQTEGLFNDTDPLNAENLPPVLSSISVGCSQKQVDGLLKLLHSRGVRTVGDIRGVATVRTIEIIRSIYSAEEGRQPTDFEIVANLANLTDCKDEEEMRQRIQAQVEVAQVWEDLRASFSAKVEPAKVQKHMQG